MRTTLLSKLDVPSSSAFTLNVFLRSRALGMTALNVLALGALQTGHNHTGFYVVEVLRCDLWDRVGLRLDRHFLHGDAALGTQTFGLFHAQP
jgi:hypothetical protein